MPSPLAATLFQTEHYQRHNQRRQEHLASLGLPLRGRSVLELGAGIGDHTSFFLDRDCQVTSIEGRGDLCTLLRQRFAPPLPSRWRAGPTIVQANIEELADGIVPVAEVVYCYGILYHLRAPREALAWMARHCTSLLLLETCVSFGEEETINGVAEDACDPTQSLVGAGCRPSRPWLWARLKELFEHVYVPRTQPSHEEFPVDWCAPPAQGGLVRSVFIASRQPLVQPLLATVLLLQQDRA